MEIFKIYKITYHNESAKSLRRPKDVWCLPTDAGHSVFNTSCGREGIKKFTQKIFDNKKNSKFFSRLLHDQPTDVDRSSFQMGCASAPVFEGSQLSCGVQRPCSVFGF